MEKLNLSFLTVNSARSYNFYLLPKELIDNKAFREVDYGAKILYSLMLNRASLSAVNANDFTDDNGHIFIIYTIEQVMEDMNCARQKAIKMIQQLHDIGLIEKKRQGLNKPNLIYVKDFSTIFSKDDFLKSEKHISGSMKIKLQEVRKSNRSNTNQNQNQNLSKNNIYHSEKVQNGNADINNTDTINNSSISNPDIQKTIADNIQINDLKEHNSKRSKEIDELYALIIEILKSTRTTFRISKENMPAPIVKQIFLRLRREHLEYVLDSLRRNTTKVKSAKSYLQTTLYNSVLTINNYTALDVQNFMYEKFYI